MPLQDLNSEQKKAVTFGAGPLLIVAGAGTGKTTVITERIAWLIEQQQAKSDEILALTFTDKAAGEMEERIDKLLPYGYTDLWIMTFHSFCERVLKAHGLDIGLPINFKLLNQTEQWLLLRQNLDKFKLDYYQPLGNPTKFIHALLQHFSKCKDEEIWPADYLNHADQLKINSDSMEATGGQAKKNKNKNEADGSEIKRLQEVANAYHLYQQLLLDNESLDFGDLINYTLKLFKDRPQILKKYQDQFKYILVDEFQDTNWAQYELIKMLAGQQANLTVVGDDDQSIYKFRGASVANILQFKDDFKKSQEIYLNTNYRSTQNILDLSYNFIQLNNPERLEVKLKTKKSLSKKLISATKEKGKIEHLHFTSQAQETEAVVAKIIELKKQDTNSTWNDFAILVRANNQAENFINAFLATNLPHNFVAAKGLYKKDIIIDVLSYLKLLDNYHESAALWRILSLPVVNISPVELMELNNFANRKTISLFEACLQAASLSRLSAESKRKIDKILKLIDKHTQLAENQSSKKVVFSFLQDFNFEQFLLKQEDHQAFIYLNQLFQKIDDFESSFTDKSIKNFSRLIDLELESGEQGSLSKELLEGPEAIKIMTIHAAKGLEFKYVFIINLVDKRFPSLERRDPIELPDELVKEILPAGDIHLQEERRLFYVAMTRAKHGLFFTSAENYGGKTTKKFSRFLYEIGILSKTKIFDNKDDALLPVTFKSQTPVVSSKLGISKSFSYSQLRAFASCPYQYYLQFILRVPIAGKAVFSFGKTMHSTLQNFFEIIKSGHNQGQADLFGNSSKSGPKLPSEKKLLEFYEANWIDDWYANKQEKEEYKKLGHDSLKGLYEQLKKQESLPQVIELEKGFSFKLNDFTIRGVIDRVDLLEDNKVEIIDYKTGSPQTVKTVEKDQLLIYQMGIDQIFDFKVAKLTFHYLNNNSRVSFLGTPEELERIKEKVLSVIDQIQKENFTATPAPFTCKYCDFKNICSFRE